METTPAADSAVLTRDTAASFPKNLPLCSSAVI